MQSLNATLIFIVVHAIASSKRVRVKHQKAASIILP